MASVKLSVHLPSIDSPPGATDLLHFNDSSGFPSSKQTHRSREKAIVNPYSATPLTNLKRGFYAEHSTRIEAAFLFRVVEIRHPIALELVYSGWWFRQTIDIAGIRVWSQISWLRIQDRAEFRLPQSIDPEGREGRIEIDFSRSLRICRFRIWIADQLVYDEVDG
jgi:hypothetical protein